MKKRWGIVTADGQDVAAAFVFVFVVIDIIHNHHFRTYRLYFGSRMYRIFTVSIELQSCSFRNDCIVSSYQTKGEYIEERKKYKCKYLKKKARDCHGRWPGCGRSLWICVRRHRYHPSTYRLALLAMVLLFLYPSIRLCDSGRGKEKKQTRIY